MNLQSNRVSAKQYTYTKDNVYLTNEQRDFYEENGYVVIRDLVDFKLLDECKERFIDICNGKADISQFMTLIKDSSLKLKNAKGEFLIYKIQDFNFDEVLFKYTSYKPIVDIIQSIIGPNITSFNSMLINKPPDSEKDASRHPLHQDLHYFPFRPAESIVASWTAMEKIDEKNGCLFVVPGSHKGELLKHDYPPNVPNKAFHGALGMDNAHTVNLIMEKGDTVFFHPTLLHGSGPNLTKGFRKAISNHYADSNCHFITMSGTIHENAEKEVMDIVEIRGFSRIPYDLFIKVRSVLVRGNPGNFQIVNSQL